MSIRSNLVVVMSMMKTFWLVNVPAITRALKILFP